MKTIKKRSMCKRIDETTRHARTQQVHRSRSSRTRHHIPRHVPPLRIPHEPVLLCWWPLLHTGLPRAVSAAQTHHHRHLSRLSRWFVPNLPVCGCLMPHQRRCWTLRARWSCHSHAAAPACMCSGHGLFCDWEVAGGQTPQGRAESPYHTQQQQQEVRKKGGGARG